MKIVEYLPSLSTDPGDKVANEKLYNRVKELCKKYNFKILTRADNEKKS